MTALAANRDAHEHFGRERQYIVLNGATVFKNAMVGLNSAGTVQPMAASVSGGLKCVGIALEKVVGDGARKVNVISGFYSMHNSSSADALDLASIGNVVYAADDQTVAKTDNGGLRSAAGVLFGIDPEDSTQIIVAVGRTTSAGQSDLRYVSLEKVSSKGADAEIARFVAPVGMRLVRFYTVLNGALAVGDATVTAKVNATAITGGALTITQSGSAAGNVNSAVPSALNTLAAGDVLSFTVGGASTATATLNISAVLQPL